MKDSVKIKHVTPELKRSMKTAAKAAGLTTGVWLKMAVYNQLRMSA